MKHYLLFANQLYSYPILRPLQKAIKSRGDDAAWFIHDIPDLLTEDDCRALNSIKAVQQYNPAAVFVPTNWVPDFFPGVKVEVFHGFNVGKRANTNQDHFRIRGHFDLYCTQGPDTTEPFQQLAEKHGYFKIAETGWSKLDPMFNYPTPDKLRSQIGTDKPIILFASTFSPKLTSAPALADTIRKLSATGRWHWIVTLHPKMDPAIVDIYRNMAGEHLSFFESDQEIIPLLHAADAMLCDTSSIFLEYLLLNKPVVTFNTAVPGPHVINIHNTDEVAASLQTALERPADLMQAIEQYGDHIHPCRDGKSSERILQATDDFIARDYASLKSKPLNLGRKLQMRKKLGYYKFK
ncbi:MAG: CDP-glycerol glycerophosphotransferase family protein [Gammaproteobacteria bacterium]|nr:CDP-glycerol glycerophosphotransferase family protein [Gammaproteobacteria bacterium]